LFEGVVSSFFLERASLCPAIHDRSVLPFPAISEGKAY
jgi:hypothetical protein